MTNTEVIQAVLKAIQRKRDNYEYGQMIVTIPAKLAPLMDRFYQPELWGQKTVQDRILEIEGVVGVEVSGEAIGVKMEGVDLNHIFEKFASEGFSGDAAAIAQVDFIRAIEYYEAEKAKLPAKTPVLTRKCLDAIGAVINRRWSSLLGTEDFLKQEIDKMHEVLHKELGIDFEIKT